MLSISHFPWIIYAYVFEIVQKVFFCVIPASDKQAYGEGGSHRHGGGGRRRAGAGRARRARHRAREQEIAFGLSVSITLFGKLV